jgi:tRNA threonylcarbamoyladenosine biosynthesis protein TsaB
MKLAAAGGADRDVNFMIGAKVVLVIDTSTPAVTVAVASVEATDVRVLAQRVSVDARAHGELLAPAVAGVFKDAGIEAGDVTAVVAGLGPGPFTGLRVGLVTAAVLGQTLGIPTYGVCSLDGIGAVTTGATLVATDARRKEVYWAGYRDGVRITGPAVAKPADVPADGYEQAAGEGAAKYGLGLTLLEEPRYPVPLALARAAADRVLTEAHGEQLTPLYLRRPDVAEPTAPKAVLR